MRILAVLLMLSLTGCGKQVIVTRQYGLNSYVPYNLKILSIDTIGGIKEIKALVRKTDLEP